MEITVQSIDKTGFILNCNHAGHETELLPNSVADDADCTFIEVCDKCHAQLIDGEWVDGENFKDLETTTIAKPNGKKWMDIK